MVRKLLHLRFSFLSENNTQLFSSAECKIQLDVSAIRVKMCVPQCLPQLILRSFMRKANCEQSAKQSVDTFNVSNQAELRKQIELLKQKMSKSPNNMKDCGSHFLYRRERMIRFKMLQKNMPQKMLAKKLNLTESYISKLITGERYNKDFERYIIHILDLNYCCI